MMKKLLFWTLCVAVISFTGCDPEDDRSNGISLPEVSDAEFAKNFGAEVQRDFIGQVVDVNNEPVVAATVKIGTASVQTDANGVFIVNGASVYEKFAHVTATKAGYISGSRSLVPTTGKNNIKIMLLAATPVQTIASGATAAVDLPNGTKVVFDGAFTDESGNAYSGNVNVSVFHLESSNENLGSLMPGMLYAKNESGQPVGLETFGMLHVELRGSGGQKLQIATGHLAQMTMPIDNTQLATAPATIPLWHFDEANGYWKQEGLAIRQGGKYVGNVSHFSWWNCDAPFPTYKLTVIATGINGLPLRNIGVVL
ncbi:carboxypeptidase-like regulatory domain-containing protein [Flavobacterium sp.]|uniref:carboxypeptidase-like regulatory domain-containing protein n=1 Tax=Flavobacterium sp. TaxID=239 RepID=UPI0039E6E3F2